MGTTDLDAITSRANDYRRRFEAGEITTLAYDICGIDIPALTARIREQATMLRRLEWSQRDFDSAAMEPVDACPVCRNWQERGHAPDCELAALLAALPGAAEEGE
jgi:hypothetical protein